MASCKCGNLKKLEYSLSCRSCASKKRQVRLWRQESYKQLMHKSHLGKIPTNLEQLRQINIGNKYKLGQTSWNKGLRTAVVSMAKIDDYRMRRLFRIRMQKLVFERDNYTCQICSIRGVDLQVDHIQSWAEYVEQRFSLNNCRTLCAKCHYKITFGKPMPENVKGWGHNLLRGWST